MKNCEMLFVSVKKYRGEGLLTFLLVYIVRIFVYWLRYLIFPEKESILDVPRDLKNNTNNNNNNNRTIK